MRMYYVLVFSVSFCVHQVLRMVIAARVRVSVDDVDENKNQN
jgi:hypothetical protein